MKSWNPDAILPPHYDITVWRWRGGRWIPHQQERYHLTNHEIRGLPTKSGRVAHNRTEVIATTRKKYRAEGPKICGNCGLYKPGAHSRRCGRGWKKIGATNDK